MKNEGVLHNIYNLSLFIRTLYAAIWECQRRKTWGRMADVFRYSQQNLKNWVTEAKIKVRLVSSFSRNPVFDSRGRYKMGFAQRIKTVPVHKIICLCKMYFTTPTIAAILDLFFIYFLH
ncbi:hypothetical protein DP117_18815 [Brasilonema sp. UFV-L1]|nr:hypothetical protein [Brasilonema sp. UFV-L1]